ncbi:abortive infection protein [Candidatus Vecturithrix granuli]|uniref:Abortive infection protein n=1 Tax=Vecturithrix granuli TaxID=1499967 RepID=A0A081C3W6_VECG1|nr:abortive infection protein [Candidatus Vecturithrix granuli]
MIFRVFHTYSRQLLFRVFLLEGGLLGVALLWAFWQDIPLYAALIPSMIAWIQGIFLGFLFLIFNYAVIEWGARYSKILYTLKRLIESDVSPLFRHIDVHTVVVIALMSGVAEEIFFRGVLQAQFGIWITSAVFGLAHIWKKTAIVYGMYVALMGLVFGSIYECSGNLWVPILAHVVNNLIAILYYIRHILTPSKSHITQEESNE